MTKIQTYEHKIKISQAKQLDLLDDVEYKYLKNIINDDDKYFDVDITYYGVEKVYYDFYIIRFTFDKKKVGYGVGLYIEEFSAKDKLMKDIYKFNNLEKKEN